LLDSGGLADQHLNPCTQPCFALHAHVVHTLEETPGARAVLVCNAPMRAQPAPPERPEACHGMHLDCTHPVAIVGASACASSVGATLLVVAPGLPTGIQAGRVRLHPCAGHPHMPRPWNPI